MTVPTDLSRLNFQMQEWARKLRIAAQHLEHVAASSADPSNTLYKVAKGHVDYVADEMYAANDAMARAAWKQVAGLHVDLPISGKRAAS